MTHGRSRRRGLAHQLDLRRALEPGRQADRNREPRRQRAPVGRCHGQDREKNRHHEVAAAHESRRTGPRAFRALPRRWPFARRRRRRPSRPHLQRRDRRADRGSAVHRARSDIEVASLHRNDGERPRRFGGDDGDLVVYDTKTKAERYRLPGSAGKYPVFAVSETAGLLATTAPGKRRNNPREQSVFIQLRKLATGEKVWEAEAKGDVSADEMAFSRDGKQLAAAVNGQVYVYAAADKQLIGKVLVFPSFGSLHVAFTADGKRLIAGRRHAQLWDIATGKRLHHFGPFTDLLHSVDDVSPNGKYLVTGHIGSDGRIWEIDTGTFFRRLGKNVDPPS